MKESYDETYLSASGAEHAKGRLKWLPGAVLAFLMLCGILFAFRDIMAGNICLISAGTAGAVVILACMLSDSDSVIGRVARMTVYGISVAGFLLLLMFVVNGFLDTANRVITLWNMRFDTEARLFKVSRNMFSSAVFWTLISVLLSVFLAFGVLRNRVVFLTVLLSGSLLFAFVVGRSAGWETVLLSGMGIFGTFLYAAAPGRILQPGGLLCIFMSVAVMLGLAFVFREYNGAETLSKWKLQVHDRVEQLRYGEDSLPEGNLERAHELLDSEEEMLQISVDSPQELYLRGFVGSVYQNDRWTPLVWADYQGKYEGILEWLTGQDFVPMAQYAKYERAGGQHDGGQTDTVKVEVKNVGAYRKYVYSPVSLSSLEGAGIKAEKDAQFISKKIFGAKKYAFEMINRAPTAEKFLTPQWLEAPETAEQEKYCDTESVYHSFVNDKYTEVDENIKDLIQKKFFSESEEFADFSETTKQIRRVLRANAEYTDTPLKLPEGKDMVSWFLEEAKMGNAVHFATTAVMAYRTAGYPARYVEGYHLTEERSEDMEDEGLKTVTLNGKDAHAWVEVYIFGAGWLPVEVTPGMYTESYTEQIVEGKPSYQIGTHKEDEGLNLEEGESHAGEEKEENPEEKERIVYFIPEVLLLTAYLLFILFLLCEAQRAARIFIRRRKKGNYAGNAYGEADRMERLLRIAGIKGKYDHPFEIAEQVECCLPGIREADYRRAVELIQKEKFGGHELRQGERYTLRKFDGRLRESLYRKKGLVFRLLLRYWYAVEKDG